MSGSLNAQEAFSDKTSAGKGNTIPALLNFGVELSEIASPFYNSESPDTRYLDRIPKWAWPFTCRCRKSYGMLLDIEREMMVCENCRLPAGFQVTRFQNSVTGQCIFCGNDYVLWNKNKQNDMCHDCGGTNAAQKGQRTIDPNTIELPDVD